MFPYYDHFNSDHLVISTFQHAAKFFPTEIKRTNMKQPLFKINCKRSSMFIPSLCLKSRAVSPQIVSGFQPFNLGLKDTDARIASDRSWTKCEPSDRGTALFHNNKSVDCRTTQKIERILMIPLLDYPYT